MDENHNVGESQRGRRKPLLKRMVCSKYISIKIIRMELNIQVISESTSTQNNLSVMKLVVRGNQGV